MSILALVPRTCVEAGKSLVEHLIINPIHGLAEIARGVALAGPALVRAASEAVVEAVKARLPDEALIRVHQGAEQIVAGAKLLTAPIALVIGVLVCLNPSVIYLGWMAWIILIATSIVVG